jgi:putative NIF3 family GTP cyclohydrolase 1 type 2
MSHHEVLEAKAAGKYVILCEHTNTERGYLSEVLSLKLGKLIGDDVSVVCSEFDADPLNIV